MKLHKKAVASGKIDWLEIRDKHGNLKVRLEDVPNVLLNSGLTTGAGTGGYSNQWNAFANTDENWEDKGGTWNQSGNTITRATGSGVFPASVSRIGNELYWSSAGGNTGHRCHVLTRVSDTQITVSGLAKTITGGAIREFKVNGGAYWGSTLQSSTSAAAAAAVYDDVAGTVSTTVLVNFGSAVSGYTLGCLICSGACRVKLPSPITIDAEDQIQFSYTCVETVTGRSQVYELGAEATGLPQKYAITSIAGSGSNVDVTFTGATHFLAGDKLDLRNVRPALTNISSASSTSTTFTINTATAHGKSPGDSIVIEGASVAGYNGTHTVATGSGSILTITNAANPGAMGASGTLRLATPGTYFDDLGLATIASMVSSSVARITSAITGVAVDTTQTIGGDPGVTYKFRRISAGTWLFGSGQIYAFNEANQKAIADETGVGTLSATGGTIIISGSGGSAISAQNAAYTNDWTANAVVRANAGVGTSFTRLKQLYSNQVGWQLTFNTPFTKSEAQRFTITASKQIKRTLDISGL